eukprot:693744-Hanusia_phi.AAC.3
MVSVLQGLLILCILLGLYEASKHGIAVVEFLHLCKNIVFGVHFAIKNAEMAYISLLAWNVFHAIIIGLSRYYFGDNNCNSYMHFLLKVAFLLFLRGVVFNVTYKSITDPLHEDFILMVVVDCIFMIAGSIFVKSYVINKQSNLEEEAIVHNTLVFISNSRVIYIIWVAAFGVVYFLSNEWVQHGNAYAATIRLHTDYYNTTACSRNLTCHELCLVNEKVIEQWQFNGIPFIICYQCLIFLSSVLGVLPMRTVLPIFLTKADGTDLKILEHHKHFAYYIHNMQMFVSYGISIGTIVLLCMNIKPLEFKWWLLVIFSTMCMVLTHIGVQNMPINRAEGSLMYKYLLPKYLCLMQAKHIICQCLLHAACIFVLYIVYQGKWKFDINTDHTPEMKSWNMGLAVILHTAFSYYMLYHSLNRDVNRLFEDYKKAAQANPAAAVKAAKP